MIRQDKSFKCRIKKEQADRRAQNQFKLSWQIDEHADVRVNKHTEQTNMLTEKRQQTQISK